MKKGNQYNLPKATIDFRMFMVSNCLVPYGLVWFGLVGSDRVCAEQIWSAFFGFIQR